MRTSQPNRRQFLGGVGALGGSVLIHSAGSASQEKPRHKVERLAVGAIGLRYQGSVIADKARAHADIVACCDVDRDVREQARASFGSTPKIFEDYREMLDRDDIDIVTIGTPDHWHAKILIDACRAGKDVYCEKPLTLTIDEGKRIRDVVAETGRVVQVGSWQRSDHRFRLAVEMVRQGSIGQLERVDVVLGKNTTGGPFETSRAPKNLNWDLWQGQTLAVPYIAERSHYTFRWWYAYSGGQITDWGAHHLDIAQWAIDALPVTVSGRADYPMIENGYDVAVNFQADYRYSNGVVMTVRDTGRNGITFTGARGRLFVNRGLIAGKPVDDLATQPLNRDDFAAYPDNLDRTERVGKLDAIVNHMGNFFDCVHSRQQPISDVESQHRSVSTCHLGNIAMRVGGNLAWDPVSESFPENAAANARVRRDQRSGFKIE